MHQPPIKKNVIHFLKPPLGKQPIRKASCFDAESADEFVVVAVHLRDSSAELVFDALRTSERQLPKEIEKPSDGSPKNYAADYETERHVAEMFYPPECLGRCAMAISSIASASPPKKTRYQASSSGNSHSRRPATYRVRAITPAIVAGVERMSTFACSVRASSFGH